MGVCVKYELRTDGRISVRDYRYDETNVDWTIPHLSSFLKKMAADSGADHINLVAHSMGNRIMTNAIARLAAQMTGSSQAAFNHIILTAPDIDSDTFQDDIAPALKRASKRVTLYASSADRALMFSKAMHGGYRRAGDSVPTPVYVEGIDSVDVSNVDTYFFGVGHSYFADNRSIVSDLFLLFRDGSPPNARNLLPQPSTAPRFWVFRP